MTTKLAPPIIVPIRQDWAAADFTFQGPGCVVEIVEGLGLVGDCAAPITEDCTCWFAREIDRIHVSLGLIDLGGEGG